MKQLKIRVKSPEHSKIIQEKLFEMGYKWIAGKSVQFVDKPCLFTNTDDEGSITYSSNGTEEYFNSQPHTEVELVETISYELKEIKKVVKVGELSYYEDELAEALKNIKPI